MAGNLFNDFINKQLAAGQLIQAPQLLRSQVVLSKNGYIKKGDHNHKGGRLLRDLVFNPMATPPSTILVSPGNTNFRFDIPPGTVREVQYFNIRWNVSETGGVNPVNITLTHFWLQRIEMYADDKLFYTAYDVPRFFMSSIIYDTEHATNIGAYWNLNQANFTPAGTLAASATKDFVTPIINDPLSHNHINLQYIKQHIYIQCYPQAVVESSTSQGTLSLNNVYLHVGDIYEPLVPESDQAMRKLYSSYECHFVEAINLALPGQTLTASTKFNKQLANVNGSIVNLLIVVRSNTGAVLSSSNNYRTATALGSQNAQGTIQLYNNNDPIYTSPIPSEQVIRSWWMPHECASLFPSQIPYYSFFFAGLEVFRNGDASQGFLPCPGGQIYVELTPGSAFSTGTYQVDFYMFMLRRLMIDDGRISVAME